MEWTNSAIAPLNCLIIEVHHRAFLTLSRRLLYTQLTRPSNLRNASVNNLSDVVDNYMALNLTGALSMDTVHISNVYGHETETIEGYVISRQSAAVLGQQLIKWP